MCGKIDPFFSFVFADPQGGEVVRRGRPGKERQVGGREEKGVEGFEGEVDGRHHRLGHGLFRGSAKLIGEENQKDQGKKISSFLSSCPTNLWLTMWILRWM